MKKILVSLLFLLNLLGAFSEGSWTELDIPWDYTKRPLVEIVAATWSPHVPATYTQIRQLRDWLGKDKSTFIVYHRGDALETPDTKERISQIGPIFSLPQASFDRLRSPEDRIFYDPTQWRKQAAMSSIAASEIAFSLIWQKGPLYKIALGQRRLQKDLFLHLLLVEDKVSGFPNANESPENTPYYNHGDPAPNIDHPYVFRKALTPLKGIPIGEPNDTAKDVFLWQWQYIDQSEWNLENMMLAVFVTKNGKVLNSQSFYLFPPKTRKNDQQR